MRSLFFIGLLGVFIWGIARGDQDKAATDRCVEHLDPAFKRLNAVLAENHLNPLDFDPAQLRVIKDKSLNPAVTMWRFQTPNKTFIYCSPTSGDVLSFFRNDIKYTEGPGYDQPPQPNWTKEQAIAMAKTYLAALFGTFPEDVGPPEVKFEPVREIPKYYPGQWEISWPRVDEKGHLFAIDEISIYISETQGITSAVYNFFSTYQPPKEPLISRDDALKVGGPAAEILANKFIGSGFQLATPDTVVQGIVNPNHILQAKTIEDTVALRDANARLVWVINYPLTSNGTSSPHEVQVWVDAQTKEVVGGDLR